MTELLVVLFVSVLVFGATRVPSLGDALGRAVRNARSSRPEPPSEPSAPNAAPHHDHRS